MLKGSLVEKTVGLLEKNDYDTYRYHGCFDVFAKKIKRGMNIFLKVLQNIDSVSFEHANNLRAVSESLNADFFLIGEQTRAEKLEKGIVYERYGTPAVSFQTFEEIIEGGSVEFYRDRGGIYVNIDSVALRKFRKEKQLTQKELAEAAGVNKKTIYEHETRELRMLLPLAEKIEHVLEKRITKKIEQFESQTSQACALYPKNKMEINVEGTFKKMGFSVCFAKHVPFDLVAAEKAVIFSDLEDNKKAFKKRFPAFRSFIEFIKKPALLITDKFKEDMDFPCIERKELGEMNKKEIVRLAERAN